MWKESSVTYFKVLTRYEGAEITETPKMDWHANKASPEYGAGVVTATPQW